MNGPVKPIQIVDPVFNPLKSTWEYAVNLTEIKNKKCRICGCDDDHACMTENGPCYWVEADLCSACVVTANIIESVDTGRKGGRYP